MNNLLPQNRNRPSRLLITCVVVIIMSNHGNKVHSSFREEPQLPFSFPWETIQVSSPYSRRKQGKESKDAKASIATTRVEMKEHLPLPPPPCLTTTPRYKSITRHGSLSKVDDDPFFAAYMRCTKNIGETEEKMNRKKKKKKTTTMMIGGINNYGRRIEAKMSGFGFSCKSSHGVIEDAMIILPRSSRSP